MVVDALGDLEVAGVALDDQPPRVDADAAGIREERLQELGDAASARRGVHVDNPPAVEPGAGVRGRLREAFGAVGSDERGQLFGRPRTDLDLEQRVAHRGLECSGSASMCHEKASVTLMYTPRRPVVTR